MRKYIERWSPLGVSMSYEGTRMEVVKNIHHFFRSLSLRGYGPGIDTLKMVYEQIRAIILTDIYPNCYDKGWLRCEVELSRGDYARVKIWVSIEDLY